MTGFLQKKWFCGWPCCHALPLNGCYAFLGCFLKPAVLKTTGRDGEDGNESKRYPPTSPLSREAKNTGSQISGLFKGKETGAVWEMEVWAVCLLRAWCEKRLASSPPAVCAGDHSYENRGSQPSKWLWKSGQLMSSPGIWPSGFTCTGDNTGSDDQTNYERLIRGTCLQLGHDPSIKQSNWFVEFRLQSKNLKFLLNSTDFWKGWLLVLWMHFKSLLPFGIVVEQGISKFRVERVGDALEDLGSGSVSPKQSLQLTGLNEMKPRHSL